MVTPITRAELQGLERLTIQKIRDDELERFKKDVRHDVLLAASIGERFKNIYVTHWVTLGKALMLRRNYNNNEVLQQDELNILLNTCNQILSEMFPDVDISSRYNNYEPYNQPYIHIDWS